MIRALVGRGLCWLGLHSRKVIVGVPMPEVGAYRWSWCCRRGCGAEGQWLEAFCRRTV